MTVGAQLSALASLARDRVSIHAAVSAARSQNSLKPKVVLARWQDSFVFTNRSDKKKRNRGFANEVSVEFVGAGAHRARKQSVTDRFIDILQILAKYLRSGFWSARTPCTPNMARV